MFNEVLSEKFICSEENLANYINYYLSFISDLNCEVNIEVNNLPLQKYEVIISCFPKKELVTKKLIKVESITSYKYFRKEAIDGFSNKYKEDDGFTSELIYSTYKNRFESTLLFAVYYDESLKKGMHK